MTDPPKITIDRLALEIPGFDPAQAQSLAQRIASHLAHAGLADDIAIPRLSLTVDAPDTGVEQIAAAIARAVKKEAG